MSPILAGLGLIVLGLIGATFGYRIFRMLLPIYGGVAGFLLAWGWWGQSAWLLALVVGVAFAAVFAVLAYAFWSAMVTFAGVIMGGALGILIGTSLNLWGWLTALLAIGLAMVFAALFFWVRNEMVIISTAVSGATMTARGVGELFGWRSGLEGIVDSNPAWLTILVSAVALVVFVAGLLYQWRAYAKLRLYDMKRVPGAQDVVLNSRTAASIAQSRAAQTTANIYAAAGTAGSSVTSGGAAIAGVAAVAATAATMTATDVGARTSDTAGAVVTDARTVTVDLTDTSPVATATDFTAGAEDPVETAVDAVAEVSADVTGDAEGAVEAVSVAAFADEGPETAVEMSGAVENKAAPIAEAAAKALDVEIDENKVATVLADLEKQFEGLADGAKFKKALDFVEGIGPDFAAQLRAAGVNNILDLLREGATRKGRAHLAEKSGIAGQKLLEWVNHADLYRVKGIGSEYADLLEAAGVDTVPELAHRNPASLLAKIHAANEEKRLVRTLPHASDVEAWVSQAKTLPRIIQY